MIHDICWVGFRAWNPYTTINACHVAVIHENAQAPRVMQVPGGEIGRVRQGTA